MTQSITGSVKQWLEGPKPLVLLNLLAFALPITTEILVHGNWFALFATIPWGILLMFLPHMTITTLSNTTKSTVVIGLMVALATLYDANSLWFMLHPCIFGALATGTQSEK